MRLALLSDVHGNAIALEAVLSDAQAAGVDGYWLLGDHCAIGPEPARVLERVAALTGAVCTRGNTDRYVVTGELPPPTLESAERDPSLVRTFASVATSFAWTKGYVTASGWLDWLARLPLEARLTTESGIRVLGVHAAPGTDDGEGVHPGRSNAELRALMEGADADIVVTGHTHEPLVRMLGEVVVVNLGSVSNPRAGDLRASYFILDATSAGVELEARRVAYDRAAFIESVHRSRHPAAPYIVSHQQGEREARTPHGDDTPIAERTRFRVDAER